MISLWSSIVTTRIVPASDVAPFPRRIDVYPSNPFPSNPVVRCLLFVARSIRTGDVEWEICLQAEDDGTMKTGFGTSLGPALYIYLWKYLISEGDSLTV